MPNITTTKTVEFTEDDFDAILSDSISEVYHKLLKRGKNIFQEYQNRSNFGVTRPVVRLGEMLDENHIEVENRDYDAFTGKMQEEWRTHLITPVIASLREQLFLEFFYTRDWLPQYTIEEFLAEFSFDPESNVAPTNYDEIVQKYLSMRNTMAGQRQIEDHESWLVIGSIFASLATSFKGHYMKSFLSELNSLMAAGHEIE